MPFLEQIGESRRRALVLEQHYCRWSGLDRLRKRRIEKL
jgi:hypothetical protein